VLQANGIRISMDGKGRCIDNVFVERLWRSLKYEQVHLVAYEGPQAAGEYFDYFNEERSHQALGNHTPMEVYRESILMRRRLAT
jgi:putative transposase